MQTTHTVRLSKALQNIPSSFFRQMKDFQGYGTHQNKHYQVLINGLVNAAIGEVGTSNEMSGKETRSSQSPPPNYDQYNRIDLGL
jgi:hypothetical protein